MITGGLDDSAVGNQNDTWVFNPETQAWSNVVPPETVTNGSGGICGPPTDFTVVNVAAPERRSAHLGVHDASGNRLWLFGGTTDCGHIDDVWSFDLGSSAWTNIRPATSGEVCARSNDPGGCTDLCF